MDYNNQIVNFYDKIREGKVHFAYVCILTFNQAEISNAMQN